jgi:hypothetical protein
LPALFLSAALVLSAQVVPLGPRHDSGQSITGAYEGWFKNADGSFSMLFGYFNRNLREELDIPVGPENRIEPGGPDRGQPTHFLSGRQWGMFVVTVPADFGSNKLTWTLTANHQTTAIPASLDPLWEVAPFEDASHNTPPYVRLGLNGKTLHGPPLGNAAELTAATAASLDLNVWVADDANVPPGALRPKSPPVTVTWSKFRGPGEVTFSAVKPAVEKAEAQWPAALEFSGKASTAASFSEPGNYVLEVTANDWSGEGGRGFQCCWTSALVKVTVKSAGDHKEAQ